MVQGRDEFPGREIAAGAKDDNGTGFQGFAITGWFAVGCLVHRMHVVHSVVPLPQAGEEFNVSCQAMTKIVQLAGGDGFSMALGRAKITDGLVVFIGVLPSAEFQFRRTNFSFLRMFNRRFTQMNAVCVTHSEHLKFSKNPCKIKVIQSKLATIFHCFSMLWRTLYWHFH
jgi:hypothetical protein